MTTDRRGFLRSTSLAALAPLASWLGVSSMLEEPQPDPLAELIVINALGFFDDLYGNPAADPSRVMSPRALEAALASGLTALNFTVTEDILRAKQERGYFAGEIRDRAERGIGAPGERADILPFAHGLLGPDQFRSLHAALA